MFMLYQPMRTKAGSKLVHVHWDCIVIVLLEFSCKGIIENEKFFDSQIARIGFIGKSKCQKHHRHKVGVAMHNMAKWL